MDLARFVDLLQTGELHLARADQMQDKWEGVHGPANVALRPIVYREHYSTMENYFPAIAAYARTRVYMNCWNIAESESAAMWSIYDREGRGVAIRASKGAVLASLVGDNKVRGFPVTYTDYSKEWISEKNIYVPYVHKRRSFQHEQEYRLLAGWSKPGDSPAFLREKVDLSKLVGDIFVSPDAPTWFMTVVERLIESHGLTSSVQRSSLAEDPIY